MEIGSAARNKPRVTVLGSYLEREVEKRAQSRIRGREGDWDWAGNQAFILPNIKVLRDARELVSLVRNAARSIDTYRDLGASITLENLSLSNKSVAARVTENAQETCPN